MAEQDSNAVVRWIEGRRTYAVALAILACGILSAYGVEIPEYVWASLAALGLGFLRAGVQKPETEGRVACPDRARMRVSIFVGRLCDLTR